MSEAPRDQGPAGRGRRAAVGAAVGLGTAVLGAATAAAGVRLAASRLRRRPDPEAGEPLGLLPPDDLGPVTSFDGTALAVRAAGPPGAPVLLFSHGFSLDMTIWYYQWQAFSDRYRCVLVDHRAHGRSGLPPSGDFSLRAMGEDLGAVLEAVAPDGPAVLLGHSMGGMAILSLAELHPEEFGGRVAGVVLADTAASDLVRETLGDLGARAERALRPLYRVLTGDRAERIRRTVGQRVPDLALLVALATNFGPDASPSHVDYVSRLSASAPPEVWVHTIRDILDMDLRHALGNVAVPALVVVGDRDLVTPKTSAEAIRDALPRGRAVAIRRAGHLSMLERHAAFNEVVGAFLEEVVPPRAARGRRRGARR